MTREELLSGDWTGIVARLGGAAFVGASARDTKAFLRPRGIRNAVDLLLERISGNGEAARRDLTVPYTLEIRETTAG